VADLWWEQERWAVDLAQYVILMRAFLEGRLAAPEFQLLYLTLFKTDSRHRPQEIFDILDGLFADVDDYCYDDQLRRRAGGIDESQLREKVNSARERLAIVAKEHLP
jgi:hypothetical protein